VNFADEITREAYKSVMCQTGSNLIDPLDKVLWQTREDISTAVSVSMVVAVHNSVMVTHWMLPARRLKETTAEAARGKT
jgi:hypothetical protein